MPNIVTVNVTQNIAPLPATLQQSGACCSLGATTTAVDAVTLITQLSDLTAILRTALANTSLAWAANVVTVTTAAPHGLANGTSFQVTIAGATPAGYNGTFLATVTGASTFTYPLVSDPGVETVPGTWVPASVAELLAMITTYFAQGSAVAVSVLELGIGTATQGVAALSAYVTQNPNTNYVPGATGFFYAYLVPIAFANEATYLTFVATFENTTAKTYFFTMMTLGNYTSFTNLMKSVVGIVPAPAAPATEFAAAFPFYQVLSGNPSPTNKIAPFSFRFGFGVTPWPIKNNGATFTALKAAGVNWVGTGAEGGISNAILLYGTTMDGRGLAYWYSVDWVQINEDLSISNAIIDGSNNPINPLYYDQDGINRLQARAAGTLNSGVSFGLVLGTVVQTQLTADKFIAALNNGDFNGQAVINAIPFLSYTTLNPSHYREGEYDGLAVVYVPQNGFDHNVFNINVSDFVSQ
ncbi:MAG: hypothetical protein KGL39_51475 [Patescibacteria group bacterium]|nr:hypothetical protein [Patescibacteria group bacterium]